ncbi:phage tail tube protein [Moraxella nasovis]|uniref:phage tail tube protein n=1 Tax=Moraxella nasovis TaxID=2904121 RepID=UPI001F61A553|nr:phage tail tube protein [Moraxella nasovis]UNU74107.1 phage tail tube protein [Moraxella nasovis]
MSSGAKVVTAYAKQTTKTVPTTGWKILPNIKNGLSVNNTLTDSEMLSGSRIKSAGMVTGGEVAGEIETELQYGVYDELLEAAFFNEWQADARNTKLKKLSIGDTKKMFAISKDFSDINVNHVFTGCVINSLKIDITTDNLIKANFGVMGQGYQHSKETSFAKSPATATVGKPASGLSIGTIKKDGADIGICVESFSFEIDNGAEVQKCLGDNIYGGNIVAMLANISGSLTLAYGVKSHDLIVNQLTGATVSLEIPISFNETDKYIIKIPKMQVSGEIPSPSGSDLVTVDVSYTVVEESPIIEKHQA